VVMAVVARSAAIGGDRQTDVDEVELEVCGGNLVERARVVHFALGIDRGEVDLLEFGLFALFVFVELLLGHGLSLFASRFDHFGGVGARFDTVTRVQHAGFELAITVRRRAADERMQ